MVRKGRRRRKKMGNERDRERRERQREKEELQTNVESTWLEIMHILQSREGE